jgi:hypothetical protein
MARTMYTENTALYRVVLSNAVGTVAETYGPYDTVGAARRVLTGQLTGYRVRSGYTGRVEAAEVAWGEFPSEPAPAPQTPAQPLHTFTAWPKTPRLLRDCTITEKLDGTNAAVAVRRAANLPDAQRGESIGVRVGDEWWAVFAQSRNRIITPGNDNAGFAGWVWSNAHALVEALGEGLHYGEWWGSKVGRKYGLDHKRFSLFNTDKHVDLDEVIGGVPVRPVPVLYRGPFSTVEVSTVLGELAIRGSVAAPGFADPEGLCVFHHASRQVFKVTLDKQDAGKWEFEALNA